MDGWLSILQDLKTDPKDEFLAILRATVKCLTRPEKYFEKVLRLAINKRGTDEGALTRVVTTRAEIDMKIIKEEYHKRNSVTLDHAIGKDTTGDYEKMLLALIGHGDAWARYFFMTFASDGVYIYNLYSLPCFQMVACCGMGYPGFVCGP